MNYIFFTKIGTNYSEFERSCRDDMTARKMAKGNKTVIRVETENARVVYRKPLSDSEMAETMRRNG
jgi:hypothetical protein